MADQPENAGAKQGGRFQKGHSGNPSGKPKGTRHKTTLLAELLMEADAAEIVRAVLTKAKQGDMAAARIVLDRIVPVRRGSPVRFDLPEIMTAKDVAGALGALLRAVSLGEISPDEASMISGILEVRRKAIETVEFEERLTAVEAVAPAKHEVVRTVEPDSGHDD